MRSLWKGGMAVLNSIGRRRVLSSWLVLTVLLFAFRTSVLAQPATPKEYQIKAVFLFNFAQFIEWPSTALTTNTGPFRIGVLGDNPFGTFLEETVRGEAIKNHQIVVQRAQEAAELKGCQLIFISKSEKKRLPEILTSLDSAAVVTVGEVEGFAQNGGIINFYIEDKKVRFEINPAAAHRAGLKLSSQLLSLGKIVEPSGEGK